MWTSRIIQTLTMRPILLTSKSWHVKFAKLKPLVKILGLSDWHPLNCKCVSRHASHQGIAMTLGLHVLVVLGNLLIVIPYEL